MNHIKTCSLIILLIVLASCSSLQNEPDGSVAELAWIHLKNHVGSDEYMWSDLQRWEHWRMKNKAVGNDLDKKYTREWFSGRIFSKGECEKWDRGFLIEPRWCLADLY